ncbi:MAG: DUF4097 family beta strand repeat protein [Gemmatimonadaceae bacterium]|nr:DUF4097 family beta strand repeat protein [Gemmatimonadaceae bacterium]
MRKLILALLAAVSVSAGAQQRLGQDTESWRFETRVDAGKWVRIYNLNGSIEFTASPDNRVHIIAEKNTRRGNARDVYFEVVQVSGGLTVCAIFHEDTRCEEDSYSTRSRNNEQNHVSVDFRVQLPRSSRWQASSVNGGVSVRDGGEEVVAKSVNGGVSVSNARGPVRASTVNGSVNVTTSEGPVSATTVNGSVTARMDRISGDEDMSFSTVNGSVRVEVPKDFDADVRFDTMNGTISSDFPIKLSGRFGPRHAEGTIGRGGRSIRAKSVNGSVILRTL